MSHVHRPEVRAVTRLTTTRLTTARFRDGGSPPLNELVFGHLHPPTAGRNLAEDLRQSRETSRKPGRLTPAGFARVWSPPTEDHPSGRCTQTLTTRPGASTRFTKQATGLHHNRQEHQSRHHATERQLPG